MALTTHVRPLTAAQVISVFSVMKEVRWKGCKSPFAYSALLHLLVLFVLNGATLVVQWLLNANFGLWLTGESLCHNCVTDISMQLHGSNEPALIWENWENSFKAYS